MKSKENLVFLGMMGAGKSSIGSLVAKKLKLNFIDIDLEIEKLLGKSINKIFKTEGEKFFREIEEEITLKNLKLSSTIISLGGGAFLNKNIRLEIIRNHISFWLNWSDRVLIERIKKNNKRPIAFGANDNELIELIRKRSSIYSKSLYEIKCDNLSKIEITNKILKIYETH
mgnify:CR=1 FL=1